MSSYKFSPQQFICTKDPNDMKSHVDDQGNVMYHTLSVKQLQNILKAKAALLDNKKKKKIFSQLETINEKPALIKLVRKYVQPSEVKALLSSKGVTYTDYPELMKNCEYRKKYNTLAAQEKMYDDTKATYDKTWRQTANLSLGICILLVGIFYQN